MTVWFEESTLSAVFRILLKCAYITKLLYYKKIRVFRDKFWRSGGRKPSAVAMTNKENLKMKRIITFGTFDVFHVGHVNILERAAALGDYLIVGISSDQLNYSKKQRYPIYSQHDRTKIISSLKYVNEVFLEESLELKLEYIKKYKADILVMGDDWEGRFDWVKTDCEVIYLPRTPSISTTEIIEVVKNF